MFSIFRDKPFKLWTPPHSVPNDLNWWDQTLAKPPPPRPIPFPVDIHDIQAYSDASSSMGIGIVIGDRWRAWVLDKSWKTDGRDISWAEAIRFELLTHTVMETHPNLKHFRIYSDNTGVVEGWWNGRSRNPATNEVFQWIHLLEAELGVRFYTQYIASALNPADDPLRGIYPPQQLLLPPVYNYHSVVHLVLDFDHPSLVLRHTKPITRLLRAFKNQTTEIWREKFILTRSSHTRL